MKRRISVHSNCARVAVCTLATFLPCLTLVCTHAVAEERTQPELRSISPADVLSKLDLDLPGLADVKAAAAQGNSAEAFAVLLAYYRAKYPLGEQRGSVNTERLKVADDVVNHIFQYGPYEPASYGDDIRWDWDPRGDIEWVASIYRFNWALALVGAFADTRDEKYAQTFVELTRDWIEKHPLEERDRTHYVYEHWRGFAWLDIQTGKRASNLSRAFPQIIHADAFTPEFLGILLASVYDHQIKTELLPLRSIHNKAVFEQLGFVNLAHTFSEFKDSRRWMTLAAERLSENFVAQVTPDGVQREWSGGYHSAVLRDAIEVMGLMKPYQVSFSQEFHDRVRNMFEYIFWIATPELAYPMFGDTGREPVESPDRSTWELYSKLILGTSITGDPKYAARAKLDPAALPAQTSHAFRDAGMYALRNEWGPNQIYFALHCSPHAISGHDQPDNGTFELKAYGRWLMTDSGYYTYGHDADARAWHRQTRVHQTLTLDRKDTKVDGKQLLWEPTPDLTTLVVENPSYDRLVHRRTVWFVDGRFFVLLDEAIGDAPGVLDLHFQFAPGEIEIDAENHCARTRFDDVNLLVYQGPNAPVTLETEDGWFAWKYGHRVPRTAIRFQHQATAPAAYVTLLVPYTGSDAPSVKIALPDDHRIGASRAELRVEAFGKTYNLKRDLIK